MRIRGWQIVVECFVVLVSFNQVSMLAAIAKFQPGSGSSARYGALMGFLALSILVLCGPWLVGVARNWRRVSRIQRWSGALVGITSIVTVGEWMRVYAQLIGNYKIP